LSEQAAERRSSQERHSAVSKHMTTTEQQDPQPQPAVAGPVQRTVRRYPPGEETMEQSKLGSLIEAWANVAIGYGVALVSQIVVFPWFGIHVPLSTNLWIGAWFTVISLGRSYILRRWFNARLHAASHALASRAA